MQENKINIFSLGIGLIAGYVVATLFAPAKGEDLRNDIRERLHNAKEDANDKIEEKGKEFFSSVKDKVLKKNSFAEEAKKITDKYNQEIEKLASKYDT